MSTELDKQIAALTQRIKEREPLLTEAQRQGDGWKAGNLGVAQAYDKGQLRTFCAARNASRPVDGAIRSSGVFYGSNF